MPNMSRPQKISVFIPLYVVTVDKFAYGQVVSYGTVSCVIGLTTTTSNCVSSCNETVVSLGDHMHVAFELSKTAK